MTLVNEVFDQVLNLINVSMVEIEKRRYQIVYKSDGSPVTEADKYIEEKIEQILRRNFESLTFVGEETYKGNEVNMAGYIALLDPIDGTENFCSGLKEWGVSLAIWKDGQHLGSLIALPELGLSLRTGDKVIKKKSRITGFSSSYHPEIASMLSQVTEYRVTGCAVYNLYSVITGNFKRFINPKGAYAWDLLPGIMLAYEHNCNIKVNGEDFHGTYLSPEKKYKVDIQN